MAKAVEHGKVRPHYLHLNLEYYLALKTISQRTISYAKFNFDPTTSVVVWARTQFTTVRFIYLSFMLCFWIFCPAHGYTYDKRTTGQTDIYSVMHNMRLICKQTSTTRWRKHNSVRKLEEKDFNAENVRRHTSAVALQLDYRCEFAMPLRTSSCFLELISTSVCITHRQAFS